MCGVGADCRNLDWIFSDHSVWQLAAMSLVKPSRVLGGVSAWWNADEAIAYPWRPELDIAKHTNPDLLHRNFALRLLAARHSALHMLVHS